MSLNNLRAAAQQALAMLAFCSEDLHELQRERNDERLAFILKEHAKVSAALGAALDDTVEVGELADLLGDRAR